MLQKEKKIPLEELNFFEVLSNRKSTSRGKLYATCGFYSCFFFAFAFVFAFFFCFCVSTIFFGGQFEHPPPANHLEAGAVSGWRCDKARWGVSQGSGPGRGGVQHGPSQKCDTKKLWVYDRTKDNGGQPGVLFPSILLGVRQNDSH